MLINIENVIGRAGKTRDQKRAYSPDPMGSGEARIDFPDPLVLHLSLTGQSRGVLIRAEIRGQARGRCDRCLGEVVVPLETHSYLEAHESPIDPDDEALEISASGEVDLGPTLEEMVALALPMKRLCSADCRGLCPRCGQDLNQEQCQCRIEDTDPRLAVLESLRRDIGEKE